MNAKRKALIIGLGLTVLFATAKAAPQAKWKGVVVKEGDVTVVKNPKEPLYRTPGLELKEELSIGGAQAQGDSVMAQIRQVVVDDAGTMYVLDEQASDVKVFDVSGKYLRTIGRKGQGPGELEFPMTLSLNRASRELAVQLQTRGIVVFRTDGTYLRQKPLKGLITGRGRVDSRGNIYVLEIVDDDRGTSHATKKLSADGSLLATISETPAPEGRGNRIRFFMPTAYFTIDRDDRFLYGYPATYEIQFYDPTEAKVLRKIRRDYDPVAVTAEEKTGQEKEMPPEMKAAIEIEYPKDHPAYSRFFLSDLGHILVQTYEKAEGGKLVHDVFDAEGRFISRIPLKGIGLEILKGKYYALEEDDEGYQYVKRYAVKWLVK